MQEGGFLCLDFLSIFVVCASMAIRKSISLNSILLNDEVENGVVHAGAGKRKCTGEVEVAAVSETTHT